MSGELLGRLVGEMGKSVLLAFAVIFLLMSLLFRSLWIGALSMVPNVFPLLAAGGFMGFAGITIRSSIALIFAVALVNFVRGMGPMAPMGVMEVFGLCSNILSYSRLMTLGVASICLADIANMLPEMLGGGVAGFAIAAATAFHVFLKYAKLWELERRGKIS